MRIAVVFDTPYAGFTPADHERQMDLEVAQWDHDEPEMEYQIADALRERGHEIHLVGISADITALVHQLAAIKPDLVFNATESFQGDANLDYLVPAVLESEGYRYTGSPPVALLISRNKATSKKILAYDGIHVPRFTTYDPGEPIAPAADVPFPLIVKPLLADASAGIAHASVVHDGAALRERVAFIHERFRHPAIAEAFVDGRELYVTLIGNGATLQVLPLTELVFDKEKSPPEERIATQSAKWDESYRERRGIRNVLARPISQTGRERIDWACRTAFRALWLHDYARLDIRLTADDEVWLIEANANPFISYGHDVANAAAKAGMDYYQFVRGLVTPAMTRDAPPALPEP